MDYSTPSIIYLYLYHTLYLPETTSLALYPHDVSKFVLQWLRFGFDPFTLTHLTALEEAEIIPGKDSDTRISPLTLTNDHGRYITVTPERALASVGECPLDI